MTETSIQKTSATRLQVVLPEISDDTISESLRALTENLSRIDSQDSSGGGLGGEFGYGIECVTSVFEMHPFYWGDCTCGFDGRAGSWASRHTHAGYCYQIAYRALSEEHPNRYAPGGAAACLEAERKLCDKFNIPFDQGRGTAVHCTCGHNDRYAAWEKDNGHHLRCPVILPNFIHKPSGVTVNWYKWIGRDMEIKALVGFDWAACMKDCLSSAKEAHLRKLARG